MQSKKSEYVRISVTPKQAEAIRKACEFYARVINGQFSEIAWECGFNVSPSAHGTDEYDKAMDLLYQARAALFPQLGTYRGTHWGVGKNDRSDIVWDIHTVLRHAMWKHDNADNPNPDYTVASFPPMQWGSEPMCKVQYILGEPGKR